MSDTILIADDEASIRDLARLYLEKEGFRVPVSYTHLDVYKRQGMRKARDLSRAAKIEEILLVYLPFWRVEATVAGWLFGRLRKDKDETKPDEHYVFESMHWNDAAVDVTEFGVHRIVVSRQDLLPFDSQALHAEAMVFEPSESRTAAQDEARAHFLYRSRTAAGQTTTSYENIQLMRPEFALVYFPVWLARYSYRNRVYQVVVDGVSGKVMYGKAPGSILYRAAALVTGLAVGNLVLVNGTILAGLVANDDDSLGSVSYTHLDVYKRQM